MRLCRALPQAPGPAPSQRGSPFIRLGHVVLLFGASGVRQTSLAFLALPGPQVIQLSRLHTFSRKMGLIVPP